MTISRLITKSLIAMASVGMLLPNVGLAANPGQAPAVRDVALSSGGVLYGQVMSAQGATQAKAQVALLKYGKVTNKLITDDQGRFAVKNVKAGLFVVSTPGAQVAVRAWAPQTAPPSAARGVLLVPTGDVVSGAFGPWHHKIDRRAVMVGGALTAAGVIGGVIGYNVRDLSSP